MKKNATVIKGAAEFKKMLDDVRIGRLKNGKNKTLLSYKRMTSAITRVPNLKKILMEGDIKDGSK